MAAIETREQLDKLLVPALKEKLKDQGLAVSGTKQQLVDRLLAAAASANKSAGKAADSTEKSQPPPPPEAASEMQVDASGDQKIEAQPEEPKELECDAPADKRAKIKDVVVFPTPDTTLNVMPATHPGMLMTLNEGGMQYFLAGARSSVGLKAGRYVFEVKVIELLNQIEAPTAVAQTKSLTKNVLRIGLSTAGSLPLLGDTDESVCFDADGHFCYDKNKRQVCEKLSSDSVYSFVVNLYGEGKPNAGTISLFRDGQRSSPPQALPDSLKGRILYPTVTYKNMSLHVNFGPELEKALPFACRCVQDAAQEDVVVSKYSAPKDGKHDLLFPVMLPDEGTFEWLDWFLEKNVGYTELSDRKIIEWAVRSGLWRPKPNQIKTSNDKPDMNFGIGQIDDGSVKQMLTMAASIQPRNLVVMEVKNNLTKKERTDALSKYRLPHFRKVARVMLGEPNAEYKDTILKAKLKLKQEKADAQHLVKIKEKQRKRQIEIRQKTVEAAKQKAEFLKKKMEEEKKKADVDAAAGGAKEDGPAAEKKEEEAKQPDEAMEGQAEVPEVAEEDEPPPKVELSAQEVRELWATKGVGEVKDLTQAALSTSYRNFSVPQDDEGFDCIEYNWKPKDACEEHMKQWILHRKLTVRIDDIQPSEWFREKLGEWQSQLQSWHKKRVDFNDPAKRAEAVLESNKVKDSEQTVDKKDATEDDDPMKFLEAELKRQDLDIFGIDNISDVGNGRPLFADFSFEDWALLSLRFELHLLIHAFKRDCKDSERTGIHPEHLGFYYQKYFKKGLNPKNYGMETVEDLVWLLRDTLTICMKVIESQLNDDLEAHDIFVKLTEESRRERQRRIDMGDEGAVLKFTTRASDVMPVTSKAKAKMQAPAPDMGGKGCGKALWAEAAANQGGCGKAGAFTPGAKFGPGPIRPMGQGQPRAAMRAPWQPGGMAPGMAQGMQAMMSQLPGGMAGMMGGMAKAMGMMGGSAKAPGAWSAPQRPGPYGAMQGGPMQGGRPKMGGMPMGGNAMPKGMNWGW